VNPNSVLGKASMEYANQYLGELQNYKKKYDANETTPYYLPEELKEGLRSEKDEINAILHDKEKIYLSSLLITLFLAYDKRTQIIDENLLDKIIKNTTFQNSTNKVYENASILNELTPMIQSLLKNPLTLTENDKKFYNTLVNKLAGNKSLWNRFFGKGGKTRKAKRRSRRKMGKRKQRKTRRQRK
jgi:hypothetical protein